MATEEKVSQLCEICSVDAGMARNLLGATGGNLEEAITLHFAGGEATPTTERVIDRASNFCDSEEGGTWTSHSNIDMCRQGDVEIIHDWKKTKTLEELKRIVEQKNYSAVTVSAGEPSFGHAALKTFDYQLTPGHCKPITTCCHHPCTIHIYTPPAHRAKPIRKEIPADKEAPKLVLVDKGSSGQAIFEHAEALAKGQDFVPLTLKSPVGNAIVNQSPYEMVYAHYHLYKAAVGSADLAVRARLEGDGFLTREGDGFVFDIDKWKYEVGNHLWMLREHDDSSGSDTRRGGGGRCFKVNLPEGTISPIKAPHLVLGLAVPSIHLVSKDSPKRCVFEHADKLREGMNGGVTPLTMLSPIQGLAIVTKHDQPKSFHGVCEYIELGFGPADDAIHVKYSEDAWITREKVRITTRVESVDRPGTFVGKPVDKEYEMVFDVAFGKMDQGNVVNMLQMSNGAESKEPGNAARKFTVNEDGTISPSTALHLVLGMEHLM